MPKSPNLSLLLSILHWGASWGARHKGVLYCKDSQTYIEILIPHLKKKLMVTYFWGRGRDRVRAGEGQRERGRHGICSRLHAPYCQHRARCGARSHKLWDNDLSQSGTLNRLHHPGAPKLYVFFYHVWSLIYSFPVESYTQLQASLLVDWVVKKTGRASVSVTTEIWKYFWRKMSM